jgi:hypothetical protein
LRLTDAQRPPAAPAIPGGSCAPPRFRAL